MSKNKNVIRFNCPQCNIKLVTSSEYIGREARCAKCRTDLIIPEVSSRTQNTEFQFGIFFRLVEEILKNKSEFFLTIEELWEEVDKKDLLKYFKTGGKPSYTFFCLMLIDYLKKKDSILIGVGKNPIRYTVKSKYKENTTTCDNVQVDSPSNISEQYRLKMSALFKSEINSDFLDSFISQAGDRFKKDKWQLKGLTPADIKSYFENKFCTPKSLSSNEVIQVLLKKIEMTVNSSQSTAKLVGKVYLVFGMIWIKLIDEEIFLTETQINRIYKILHYFIDIDDFVPDTSVGGYLDDLYVSTFAFKRFRKNKKETIMGILKRGLNQ